MGHHPSQRPARDEPVGARSNPRPHGVRHYTVSQWRHRARVWRRPRLQHIPEPYACMPPWWRGTPAGHLRCGRRTRRRPAPPRDHTETQSRSNAMPATPWCAASLAAQGRGRPNPLAHARNRGVCARTRPRGLTHWLGRGANRVPTLSARTHACVARTRTHTHTHTHSHLRCAGAHVRSHSRTAAAST